MLISTQFNVIVVIRKIPLFLVAVHIKWTEKLEIAHVSVLFSDISE